MKKLILFLLPAFFLFSCGDSNVVKEPEERKPDDKETGWSDNEREQSMDNCIEWKTGDKHNLSKKEAKKLCTCLVDAAESVFSYDDWEKLEKDPDDEDISKAKVKKYNKKVNDCNDGSGDEREPEDGEDDDLDEDRKNEDEQ